MAVFHLTVALMALPALVAAAQGPSAQENSDSHARHHGRMRYRRHEGAHQETKKEKSVEAELRFSADEEAAASTQDRHTAALPRLRICNAHPDGDMTVSMARSSAHTGRYAGPSKEHTERTKDTQSLLSIVPEEEEEEDDSAEDESGDSDVTMQASPSSVASSYATRGSKQRDWRYRAGRDTPGFEARLKVLGKIPMQACREFVTEIGAGDYLRFEIAGTRHRRAGIYVPDDPDGSEGRIFIMAYTKDAINSKIEIKVHFFERMHMPRVAAVNVAPPGPKSSVSGGEVRITRREGDKHVDNVVMRYDTVTSIDAGWHVVELVDSDGNVEVSAELQSEHGEGYVIARVEPGKVIVFPHPAPYATYDEWLAAMKRKREEPQPTKKDPNVRSGAFLSSMAANALAAVLLAALC